MLSIAGGIVLGFLAIVGIVLAILFFIRVPVFHGIAEGWRGFREGMKK
jgi:hypothetical protein